jgi:hypothetical protein
MTLVRCSAAPGGQIGGNRSALTPDDDVEDQDNEAQDSTTSAVLPRGLGLDASRGGSKGQGSQPKLEEVGESWRDHVDVDVLLCLSRAKEGSSRSSL